MRILQIIPGADSFRVFLGELTESMLDSGHEVLTVFNPQGGISDQTVVGPGLIRHLDFPRGASPLGYLKAVRQLRKVFKEFQPDIVHAHFSSGILTAALARMSGLKCKQWIGTFQGIQFPYATGSLGCIIRIMESRAAAKLDKTFVLTNDDLAALHKEVPSACVQLQKSLGFGCHDRFFDTAIPNTEARDAFRETLEISPEDRVFIFIGRMVAHKGFHLAARAFMKATKVRPNIRWIVIGERDPLHSTGLSDDEWAQFEAHPAIRFLGVQDDVLPYLDAADAMLFPTSREGMPVSVMEGLARRVPVLTNKVRGCRELIQPGENGDFFESHEVAAVTAVLGKFEPMPRFTPNEAMRRSNWIREVSELYRDLDGTIA